MWQVKQVEQPGFAGFFAKQALRVVNWWRTGGSRSMGMCGWFCLDLGGETRHVVGVTGASDSCCPAALRRLRRRYSEAKAALSFGLRRYACLP